ncbi:MAG: DUF1570 domain-containing protein, partial [Phycisphaerae bacterium]|nr:DUF1570 domain-containing protein [Phycisphaerae bacterium]
MTEKIRAAFIGMVAAALFSGALLAGSGSTREPWRGKEGMKAYKTPYYTIYTDREIEMVREAAARMTAMAGDYRRRTKGFSKAVPKRMPFYLFSKPSDYHLAGGMRGSAGVYMGDKLMAMAPVGTDDFVWEIVQHEAFHQFAHKAVSDKLPVWVDEGLAEYFGCGIWTGDGFVTGLIPPRRMKRIQHHIKKDNILPFLEMITMDLRQWNRQMSHRNYDQAWSMVHFLIHADDGKYEKAFAAFIKDIVRGRRWRQAFQARLGRDLEGFQKQYMQWWTSLPENPTAQRYTRAVVETLTSFLARASRQKMKFESVEEFFEAAGDGKIKVDIRKAPRLWLPPKLLKDALKEAQNLEEWSLDVSRKRPGLILTQPDGTTFTGTFTLRLNRISVKVTVE